MADFARAFADEDKGGRYGADKQTIHTAENPIYPEQPADSPFHHDPVGPEPPLGFDVNAVEPCGTVPEIQQSLERLGETVHPSGEPNGDEVGSDAGLPSGIVETASPLKRNPRKRG